MEEDYVAEDELEEDEVEDDDVKREEDDHVEEEEDDDVEDDYDVEEEDRSQDLGPHFVRSCAVECTSTYHKSHFTCKFTGKTPRPRT